LVKAVGHLALLINGLKPIVVITGSLDPEAFLPADELGARMRSIQGTFRNWRGSALQPGAFTEREKASAYKVG
jgi:hypothetical protein